MLKETEIKQLIDNDAGSERKKAAAVGHRYYNGEHDIRNYRLYYYNADGDLVEDTTRSNIKIAHPFFTELVDQCVQYMLSGTHYPVQFEVQMPKGTKGFITSNLDESEYIARKGSTIEIIGAEVYNDGAKDCIKIFGKMIQGE